MFEFHVSKDLKLLVKTKTMFQNEFQHTFEYLFTQIAQKIILMWNPYRVVTTLNFIK